MDLGIVDNVAIVTASSQGLGRAAAEGLAAEGCNVVMNGRTSETLQDAVAEVDDVGSGAVVGVSADITRPDGIERLVERTLDRFGRIDHLVTNAGGPPSGPVSGLDDDDWYHAVDLLLMSVVRLVRHCERPLRTDGGTVVTIASTSVKEAVESLPLSNSVRMAVIGLEKTLSREFAPDVRSNAVLAGPHETDRYRQLLEEQAVADDDLSYEDHLERTAEGIPLDRIGQPHELGDVVAYLSSERSSFINGAAIPVDGGMSQSTL